MQEHEVKVNPEPAILGLPSSFFQSLPLGQVGYTDRGNGVACKWWAPVASLLLGSLKKDISPTYCLESPDGILEHLEAELVDAVLAGSLKLDRIYDSLQPPRHLLDPELATLPHIQVKLKGPHYDGKRDEPLQEWQGSCLRRRRRRGGRGEEAHSRCDRSASSLLSVSCIQITPIFLPPSSARHAAHGESPPVKWRPEPRQRKGEKERERACPTLQEVFRPFPHDEFSWTSWMRRKRFGGKSRVCETVD